jgi:hypothetical protein
VIGRFSLGGGDPHTAGALSSVRGLGLQLSLPGGEQWRTAMINLPVFPFKDEQAFYDNLVASEPDPNTQQPDPAQGAAFVAHFGAVLFRTLIVRDGLLSRMLPEWARARVLETAFLLARNAKRRHLIAPAARPRRSCF